MQRLDHVRAVLDNLMGHNRDGDMADYEIRSFEDRRVCKPHLLGLCVHDRFFNTTLDQGACRAEACGEAADKFRKQYLAWRGSGPDRWEYVREQLSMMDAFIAIVDRGIERNQRRTETAQGYKPETVDLDAHPEILEVTSRIDTAVKEAEAAGEEGRVDESQRLMDEAERLKTEKLALQRRILGTAPRGQVGNGHLLQACSACGAMLSERDSDDRLREHFEGRMHRGVVAVRERLRELRGGGRPAEAAAAPAPRPSHPARAGPPAAGHGTEARAGRDEDRAAAASVAGAGAGVASGGYSRGAR